MDLSHEGGGKRVSRRQAHLSLRGDGAFHLHNVGRRAMAVDNCLLDQGRAALLRHLSLIQVRRVGCLRTKAFAATLQSFICASGPHMMVIMRQLVQV